jgi:DNA-binding NtrC family response regulator
VTKDEDNASQFQEDRDGVGALPLKSVECGNKSKAAQKLHWSRMTLYRKMTKYQLVY